VVRHKLSLGSHDLFLGEVVALHADEEILDEHGNPSAVKARLISYDQPGYLGVGSLIGLHGYSKATKPA